MGPIVPNLIGYEFDLIIAIFIGFCFGFVLEQAGFSTTKKLVGLFYGYDFTVLKVFFTAGITAMIGLIVLEHQGLINISAIYINPTFLWSAIIGGLIMGVGFIVGGFCPGTSVCAAAIGKIDAMFFLVGATIGVLIFGEMYPLFEGIYLAKSMGDIRVDAFFGISPKLFALIMSFIAVAAFYFTQKIQNKVNKITPEYSKKTIYKYSALAALPFVVLIFTAILPSRMEIIQKNIADEKRLEECVKYEIDADKLAIELVNNYHKINLIDVRTKEEYEKYHLPLAINIPLSDIFDSKYYDYFRQNYKTNIFYADDNLSARKAFLSTNYIGASEAKILNCSSQSFKSLIIEPAVPEAGVGKDILNLYYFRTATAEKLLNIQNIMKKFDAAPVENKATKKGGC